MVPVNVKTSTNVSGPLVSVVVPMLCDVNIAHVSSDNWPTVLPNHIAIARDAAMSGAGASPTTALLRPR